MKTMNTIFVMFVACVAFSKCAHAQTTVGKLMDLEAKVAEKKLLDELEKSNGTAPITPGGVPPISLVGGTPKMAAPVIGVSTPKPKAQNRPPYAINILGVDQDLKADVIVNGRQYQAVKGGMVGEYFVKSIGASGVWLEIQVASKHKGKTTYTTKAVFAALSNS
jgi:type IV pilus biogenesis protein PilP